MEVYIKVREVKLTENLNYIFYDNYSEALYKILLDITGSGTTYYTILTPKYHKKFVAKDSPEAYSAKKKLNAYVDRAEQIWALYKKVAEKYWEATKEDYLSPAAREKGYAELHEFIDLDLVPETINTLRGFASNPEMLYKTILAGYLVSASGKDPALINTVLDLLGSNSSRGKTLTKMLTGVVSLVFHIMNLLVQDCVDKQELLKNGRNFREKTLVVSNKRMPVSHVVKKIAWYDMLKETKIFEAVQAVCEALEQSREKRKIEQARQIKAAVNSIKLREAMYRIAYAS